MESNCCPDIMKCSYPHCSCMPTKFGKPKRDPDGNINFHIALVLFAIIMLTWFMRVI